MKVASHNAGHNNFLNIRVNQSIVRQNGKNDSLQSQKAEGEDIVTISPQGRVKSFIESLMKQKQHITEQKNLLIGKTLEKGDTLDSIKPQLEAYDEQLKIIDRQISDLIAKEMEKQAEQQAEKIKPKGEDHKPKTEEEIQSERLAGISSLSDDLKQAQIVSSVKARVDGNSRVLESEIALDQSRGCLGANVAHKEAELQDMEQSSLRLASKIADELADISKEAADKSKPQEVAPETEEERPDSLL